MTNFITQILLQGILEAFPISSSMHLKTLNIANIETLHLGTGLAFLFFSIEYLFQYLKKPFSKKTIKFIFKIILLILPTILIGFYIKKQPDFISVDFVNLICSIAMLLTNTHCPSKKEFNSLKTREIMVIGLIISAALIPGASRFGVSFTAFRLFHLTQQESFLFSVIIGVPITIGAATLNALQEPFPPYLAIASLLAGIITYESLKITKKLLKYWNFFSFYRIIFSIIHTFLTSSQKTNLIAYTMFILCMIFGIDPKKSPNKEHKIKQVKIKKKSLLKTYLNPNGNQTL